jgi:TRAP-type C4-dicarboxylate transport system substrate-binding protein
VTAVGLSQIHKPFLALQMPGVFTSWAALDSARSKLMPDFDQVMRQKGFALLGHGDVGVARVMSRGFQVRVPTDLKGKNPAVISEDFISPKVYEVVGGVSPVPSSVMTFLPKLNNGSVNVLNTPSLAAEQLQWSSRLDHINTGPTYFAVGAIVMSQAQLEKMPADQREVLASTGKKAAAALTARIRAADDEAFARLKKKMKTHNPSAAEVSEWKKVFKEACRRLKGALPPDVLAKVGAC